MLRILSVGCLAGALAIAGCGVVYTSPHVRDGSSFGTASNTGYDVKVVTLTPETTIEANLAEYVPPRLPLAFQPGAAAKAAKSVRPVSLDPIPAPSANVMPKPNFIEEVFPPLGEARPYNIGVGDVVVLAITADATLENLPDLITAQSKRQGFVVQDDGAIAVPDVGRVRIAGLTLQDAEEEIFQAMISAGIDPKFTLEIADFNSQRISVGGEVGQPSLVPIGLKPLYLHEAIDLAGGARVVDPMVSRVQLIRDGRIYQIGLERFNTDPAARRIILQDGDSVFVGSEYREEAAQRAFQERLQVRDQQIQTQGYQLQRAQFEAQQAAEAREALEDEREVFKDRLELGAVERDYAYVTGEIRVTKRFELPFERTAKLADALFDSSIIDIKTADYQELYVLRPNTNPAEAGGITAYNLDGSNAVNFALAGQFELRPNDVIFIAEQPITSWNRVISQILPNLFLSAANIATGI
ncbi:polysaccharide biosynthesis/export family protein [Rhodobacteraceae bacterium NNCM2]|nr:polysaccharide biosynthesis/export family protein [Coraliihabitans acroporae]